MWFSFLEWKPPLAIKMDAKNIKDIALMWIVSYGNANIFGKQDRMIAKKMHAMQNEIPSLSGDGGKKIVYFVSCVLLFVLVPIQFRLIFLVSFLFYYSVYPTVQLYPHSE